ncbi:MAG: alpha-D-ribose 1-methylphosphonate 5-triphosphate diphosphatase [Hyphomicrobiales bacterium]|nr:alpha-D-ribose 1-methylphosphonate 5-triphosphate diphosphatase [Hyphomicrobiales bacterium]
MLRPPLADRLPSWTIENGRVLHDEGFDEAALVLDAGLIVEAAEATDRRFDASGLLVLPGVVDVHGDAFERQLMPRPGVGFDLATALFDTDRQLLTNGVTTAFHGVTWSWEPGLRGAENARALLDALERLGPDLLVDTRYHLRHETYNLDGEAEILDWIEKGRIGCLAFNDHTTGLAKYRGKPEKLATMIHRSGLDQNDFLALVESVHARADAVAPSIERLAAAARAANVPMLSHDDMSPQMRRWYRDLGVAVAEFPMDEATARAAIEVGEATVFGAPNVLRGGSHTGCPAAADMVGKDLCSILASDYYYPALAAAPFRLAADGVRPLEETWSLVSKNPAAAFGLADRGRLAPGLRADVVAVDASPDRPPRVVATFVAGRLAHCADGARIG